MSLRLSTKRPLHALQRWFSYYIWANVIIIFLFWELTGDLRWTPWKTLSETAWDVEKHYPGTVRYLQAFLLGLVVHIRFQTTLESSVKWGELLETRFNKLVEQTGGDFA